MACSMNRTLFAAPSALIVCFATLLTSGCGGSVKANASAKASTDGEADFDAEADGGAGWEQTPETQNHSTTGDSNASGQGAQTPAMLGARHDLLLRDGAPAACQCLAVVVGQPGNSSLIWTGRRPVTNAQSQLVIALGSEGVPCSEAGPGASYMGYEQKDGNVIVNVEAAVTGRPVTHGAIIPRPAPGKQVYIKASGKIPYGRGAQGEAQCAVGVGQ